MVKRNENLTKLKSGYLFPEINRRKNSVLEKNPDADIISLGIGNTTEPLKDHITKGLTDGAAALGTNEGYKGYGDEQGFKALREKIADTFYKGLIQVDEVFISDGAKCDIGRLQLLFGKDVSVAVQDPSYPVYVDGSVLMGTSGFFNDELGQFTGMEYMSCTPENDFFPQLDVTAKTDIIYFCSPNNPTGAVATKKQLEELVDFAVDNGSIIVFDAAYSEYIQDEKIPKSIYDIKGADEVAIEINSFSKPVGFTGVRLGWSVVPKKLLWDDESQVNSDWNRITSTVFNGASNIAQMGGLAALDEEGLDEMKKTVAYYMENARIIKSALDEIGIKTYGGVNAPYIWAHFPGEKSWDVFENILENSFVVTTPGSGFGPGGEGFIRFSAFGHRQDVLEAVSRLKQDLI